MSEAALLHNSLVCLPTGLGKTLIAAALMYNFYRWFPRGRIVFTAPTRPLVHQQIEACRKVRAARRGARISSAGPALTPTRDARPVA